MEPLHELKEVLARDRVVHLLEDDIYSVLRDTSRFTIMTAGRLL